MLANSRAFCLQVRRAILDFNRTMKCDSKREHMTKQDVIDLLDVCCVFVYVQGQIRKIFGMDVVKQARSLWLKGSRD